MPFVDCWVSLPSVALPRAHARAGPRLLQKYASEIDLSTKLLYFSLTTFLGESGPCKNAV
jgi:hypothetical protein